VFGVYGIAVDSRHLSLIGDFMMQQGDYRPCSRAGREREHHLLILQALA
jgi:DNA-directed RNA polymerase I subunit RPA1